MAQAQTTARATAPKTVVYGIHQKRPQAVAVAREGKYTTLVPYQRECFFLHRANCKVVEDVLDLLTARSLVIHMDITRDWS